MQRGTVAYLNPHFHHGHRAPQFPFPRSTRRTTLIITMLLFSSLLILVYFYRLPYTQGHRDRFHPSPHPQTQSHWAQYSPYHPSEPYRRLPKGCQVIQTNILQRHGARFPTSSASKRIKSALTKLKAVVPKTGPLAWIGGFEYELGTDDLVPFGAAESMQAGVEHYTRYAHLVSTDNLPFVRASGSQRVILSATNWTAEFAMASNGHFKPELSVIIPEEPGYNNTLDDNQCPLALSSDQQINTWRSVYTPSIARRLAPGGNLTGEDISSLMSLCPFESVWMFGKEGARGGKAEESRWCGVFSEREWMDWEYENDLGKFYGTGYGNALGRVQGIGYTNELIARLTSSPVSDSTQTNRTLDSDPGTFPLERGVYVDFSHDNEMVAVYAAIGLFGSGGERLDPGWRDAGRMWKVGRMVPFAGRMVVEKVGCAGGRRMFVRVLVDDAVRPLEFCRARKGGAWEGMCEVDAFVESQGYARRGGDGDWERCSRR